MNKYVQAALVALVGGCVVNANGGRPGGRPSPSGPPDPEANVGEPRPQARAAPDPDAPFVGSDSHTQAGEHPPNTDDKLCDGAHDHCLPQGSTFATEWSSGPPTEYVYVAMKIDRGLWAWLRADVIRGPDVRGVDTERATTTNLKAGDLAIAYHYSDNAPLPVNEASAIAGPWLLGKVASVDRATATFRIEGEDRVLPIVGARVVKRFWIPPHE